MKLEPTKPCKDCLAERAGQSREFQDANKFSQRPAPYPGPRCATHWRAEVKRRKAANHERTVQKTYGLTDGEYEALYVWQGGRCAICQRATGATRRLSVDHDHATGEVRGLLCRPCNTVVGRAGDSPSWFYRGAEYLINPPARRMRNGQ